MSLGRESRVLFGIICGPKAEGGPLYSIRREDGDRICTGKYDYEDQTWLSVGLDERNAPIESVRPVGFHCRSGLKKARISAPRRSGCSAAAKCPPFGISVQRCTL